MSEHTTQGLRKLYSETLLEFETKRDAMLLALNDEYQPRLRSIAGAYTMLVEQAAPMKIEEGTPPNENSNPVPPACSV